MSHLINLVYMFIITVAHQKGGVGKTTLSLNLAYCLANTLRVGIADIDPQRSIINLNTLLAGIKLVGLEETLNRSVEGVDVVIIDTPPYNAEDLESVFAQSDYALIPTKTGGLDLLAIRGTIAILERAKTRHPGLRAGVVLSMVVPGSTMNDEARAQLAPYNVTVLDGVVSQRVSYARSPLVHGIFNTSDEKAKSEIVALATEIIKALKAN